MSADRHARHGLVPGWRQEALAAATVVIVGVGALGNCVAQSLALAGVGRLILCDPDVVAASNLSRAPLFTADDVGRPKVEAAAEALRRLVPGLHVEARARPLVSGVGLGELRAASLTISGLDSRRARVQLAGRCALVGARWIDAGTTAWGGEVRPFLAPDGPCFACPLTPAERGESDVPWSCHDARPAEVVGASHPVSALIASHASLWAVRALMALPVPSTWLRIDGIRGIAEPVVVARDPECPLHRRLPAARALAVSADATVGALLAALPAGAAPLAWAPLMVRVECARCDFAEARVGLPAAADCPDCGAALRVRTTLSLAEAPASARLSALGVAPREVLAVQTSGGIECFELAGA